MRIRQKITAAYPGDAFHLEDQSHLHAGHAGAQPGGETHFFLELISLRFEGMTRLERQRMIHALLAEELSKRVHALSLRLKTPAEASVI